MGNAQAMNNQTFNTETDYARIMDFYNRDMSLVRSDIELNDEAFIALLGMEGTVSYITNGFGTKRQVVWKYDGDETVIRCEVIMHKNAAGV